MNTRKKSKSRKNSLLKTFFKIVFSTVFVFLIAATALSMGFKYIFNNKEKVVSNGKNENDVNLDETKPEKINIAVFGTDEDGIRSDVNFVVCFDTDTKKISFLSIPRDTKVVMTDEMIQSLIERDRKNFIPYNNNEKGQCKFTELYAYAGEGYRNKFQVDMIEELLGIEIDNYVKVDLQGFRDIVDAIGGVDMEVETDMYWPDPYINIKAGYQHLDGDKAEQVVRFRDAYAQKDLKRIQVQQDFMKEFIKKVTNTDTILNNLSTLISTIFKYVDTDISIKDALKYSKYINDIKMENVSMETIPGEAKYDGKISYFIQDVEETKNVIDRIIYGKEDNSQLTSDEYLLNEQLEETITSSKDKKIEVSNGGITNGMAGKKKAMLEEKGYNVIAATTYNGEQVHNTRIIVKNATDGADLIPLFVDAIVEVNETLVGDNCDIKVILGLDEK